MYARLVTTSSRAERAAAGSTEFRQRFKKPVVIDMFCYRRHGHNEGDEPSFTQPLMYQRIREHESVVTSYAKRLVEKNQMSEAEVTEMRDTYRAHLDTEFKTAEAINLKNK